MTIPILQTRDRYQCCHIRVPDLEDRIPAIRIDRDYYSLFRVEAEESRAAEIAQRLMQRGDATVLTKTPKGFAIWVLETEVESVEAKLPQPRAADSNRSRTRTLPGIPCKILTSSAEYQRCSIQVPDGDQAMPAIRVEALYYSFFRTVELSQQAILIVRKLGDRGDQTVITKAAKGYSIWVLEADAIEQQP